MAQLKDISRKIAPAVLDLRAWDVTRPWLPEDAVDLRAGDDSQAVDFYEVMPVTMSDPMLVSMGRSAASLRLSSRAQRFLTLVGAALVLAVFGLLLWALISQIGSLKA